MTQIRETIESLCVVLKYNGIAEITAETFRLAKFDNQDTTKPMWFTLKNLILWLEVMKYDMTGVFNGENGSVSEELPGLVRYCKHGMFSNGYKVRSFFALPENMENGSRDILLAIGWLIAKEKLINKFATRARKIVSEDLPFKESCCAGISHKENSLCMESHSKVTNEKERLLRLIEGIILLKGRLNAAFRSLLAAKNEYSCVLNRIHRATLSFPQKSLSSTSSSHLAAIDVYLLCHEKELTRHQERLECENIYLKSLIFLMDKESSFWKWMESTLDAKIKDDEENSEEDEIPEPCTLSNVDYKPSKDIQGIKTQQVEFSRLLQKQESLYMDVSTKWKRYKNAVEESKEVHEEFLDVLSCLDQEVLAELNTLENDVNENSNFTLKTSLTALPLSSLQGPLKLIIPNLQKKKHRSMETTTNEQSAVAGVIQELSQKDERLKQQLLNLKKEHDDSMVKFSLTLKDIVCIPPYSK